MPSRGTWRDGPVKFSLGNSSLSIALPATDIPKRHVLYVLRAALLFPEIFTFKNVPIEEAY